MLKRNRVVARPRAIAPKPVEIILSAQDRRKFADFIMLLNTAERSSDLIKNARKKVKQSKIRDGPQSSGLLYIHVKLSPYSFFLDVLLLSLNLKMLLAIKANYEIYIINLVTIINSFQ